MDSVASFRIEKDTLRVEACDVFGRSREAEVFLALDPTQMRRTERLQDVFSDRGFVPLRADGKVEIVSARHIAYFKLDLLCALDELDPEVEQGDVSISNVEVYVEGGGCIGGVLRYLMPDGQRRLVDWLATNPPWIKLRTPEWLYLIPRDRVVRVVPLDGR
jgi:hypothetical protein